MHPSSLFRREMGLLLLALVVIAAPPGLAQSPPKLARPLTLAQARETALARSPSLRAARAAVAAASAELRTAGTYPFNPVIEGALGRRTGPDGSGSDRGLALSQEIEIGGQLGKRSSAARAELAAEEKRALHVERLLLTQVEHSYAEAVKGRELLRIERIDVDLARTQGEHARKRLEAGSGTQIEHNLARVTLGRAEARLRATEAAYMEARAILAESIAEVVNPLPEPTDAIPDLPPEPPDVALLLEAAVANRADIQAFAQATEAARARIRLARSEALPNLVLGGFYEREGGVEKIRGGSLAMAIPVFNRNQGGIALGHAELERTTAERAGLELAVQREVSAAYHNLASARAAAEGLRQNVIGTLEENLDLLQRSLSAGKIGSTEVLVFRREFVESQREYVEAQTFAWQMRVALDLAAGNVAVPRTTTEETQP